MPQSLRRSHALCRIPLQAPSQKIQKVLVAVHLNNPFQRSAARHSPRLSPATEALLQLHVTRLQLTHAAVPRQTVGREKVLGPLGPVQQVLRRHVQRFDDQGQLIRFVLAREQDVPGQQFHEDAAQTPHVNGHAVLGAQYHFGRPVESRLNIRVYSLVLEAG